MSSEKSFTYPGQAIDVHWDGRLCIHIGECGQSRGELFVGGRDPWCVPDKTTVDEVAEVCERCPTGALTYSARDGRQEQAPAENRVTVAYNGPLFATGDLTIEGAPADMPGVRFRAALCRCGRSNNKPFCDNSHLEAGFEDYGAIGERGPGGELPAGPLAIKPIPDGPLMLAGPFTLVAASGRSAYRGTGTALCRCGASKSKPFCDGSHNTIGFKSD